MQQVKRKCMYVYVCIKVGWGGRMKGVFKSGGVHENFYDSRFYIGAESSRNSWQLTYLIAEGVLPIKNIFKNIAVMRMVYSLHNRKESPSFLLSSSLYLWRPVVGKWSFENIEGETKITSKAFFISVILCLKCLYLCSIFVPKYDAVCQFLRHKA